MDESWWLAVAHEELDCVAWWKLRRLHGTTSVQTTFTPKDGTHSFFQVVPDWTSVIISAHWRMVISITPHSLEGKEPHLAMQIYNEQWQRSNLCHLIKNYSWSCFGHVDFVSGNLIFFVAKPWTVDFLAQGVDNRMLCCQILFPKLSVPNVSTQNLTYLTLRLQFY